MFGRFSDADKPAPTTKTCRERAGGRAITREGYDRTQTDLHRLSGLQEAGGMQVLSERPWGGGSVECLSDRVDTCAIVEEVNVRLERE